MTPDMAMPAARVTAPATGPQGWGLAVRLALRDALHDWRMTLCLVAGLAAALAPLLVLFGLRHGIVTTMTDRLLANPLVRELRLVGSHALGPDWFAQVGARPEVAFLVPRTRALAATLDAIGADGRALPPLAMQPTGPGDPLLAGLPQPATPMEVLVARPVAERLRLAVGGGFEAVLTRRLEGVQQAVRLRLTAAGIVPEALAGANTLFVDPALMLATERYRSGFPAPLLGVAEGQPPPAAEPPFASARLFARGLEDVAPLAAWLRDGGLEVQTEAAEIDFVRSVDRTLTLLFAVLAAVAVLGLVVALGASLWANVERKRRDLALLRLVGLPVAAVAAFPATQAAVVALSGSAVSLLAFAALSALLNAAFAENLPDGAVVCRLQPSHALSAVALTLLLALAASLIGAIRAARIDPAESLRDL